MIVTYEHVIVFFLILSRFFGFASSAPIFSNRNIVSFVKLAVCFWTSALVIFVVPLPPKIPEGYVAIFLAIVLDFMIGYMIGYSLDLLITSIEFAGSIMDAQSGLSAAATLDPSSGRNAAILEIAFKQLAIVVFILLNGHHIVLGTLIQSFTLMPPGYPVDINKGMLFLIEMGKDIYYISFQLAAPIILIVFIIDFMMGILNRVAEQINVFQLGFQVKPIVSLLIILGVMPVMTQTIFSVVETSIEHVNKMIALFLT